MGKQSTLEELVVSNVIDKPDADFWKDREVLVTGHTGFKGSWLVMWLHSLGARVHGFSYPPPTSPSMFESLELADLLASDTRGDVGQEGQFEHRRRSGWWVRKAMYACT